MLKHKEQKRTDEKKKNILSRQINFFNVKEDILFPLITAIVCVICRWHRAIFSSLVCYSHNFSTFLAYAGRNASVCKSAIVAQRYLLRSWISLNQDVLRVFPESFPINSTTISRARKTSVGIHHLRITLFCDFYIWSNCGKIKHNNYSSSYKLLLFSVSKIKLFFILFNLFCFVLNVAINIEDYNLLI